MTLYANVGRDGVIVFEPYPTFWAHSRLPVCFGEPKKVKAVVSAIARHAYDGETLLVPGVPEAANEDDAIEALIRFREQCEKRMKQADMNDFQKAIARARENGSPDIARRIEMEMRIADALVSHALKAGYTVSVNDSVEWVVKRSTDKDEIMGALFSTDNDVLEFRTSNGKERVGQFWLIYGNDGYDVVSDFTANETCEAIWETVIRPLADKLEREAV